MTNKWVVVIALEIIYPVFKGPERRRIDKISDFFGTFEKKYYCFIADLHSNRFQIQLLRYSKNVFM